MLDDAPACRDALQGLGDVLAELAQCGPAAARTGRGSGVDDAVARKMIRQRSASGLVPGETRNRDGLVGLRCIRASRLLQVLEPEFELLDPGAALRRGPEPLTPKPGDLQLQPLDLDAQDLFGGVARCLGRKPRLALREDHRVGGGKVGGQRLRRVWHLRR